MEIIDTGLKDCFLIKPKVFKDARGFFVETYQEKRYKDFGININFVQDNLSASSKNVLRGLHFQTEHAQDKLVSVVYGEVFDVAVDLRKGSPTFKKWFGSTLNDKNHHQLFIPKGFAHGFYVLSSTAIFSYKCSDYYNPTYEAGLSWNDEEIGIEWPIKEKPILSEKDLKNPKFNEISERTFPLYKH